MSEDDILWIGEEPFELEPETVPDSGFEDGGELADVTVSAPEDEDDPS